MKKDTQLAIIIILAAVAAGYAAPNWNTDPAEGFRSMMQPAVRPVGWMEEAEKLLKKSPLGGMPNQLKVCFFSPPKGHAFQDEMYVGCGNTEIVAQMGALKGCKDDLEFFAKGHCDNYANTESMKCDWDLSQVCGKDGKPNRRWK